VALLGAFFFIYWLVIIAVYLIFSLSFMRIAKKTNTPNGWLAFIPILSLVLAVQIADKPMWWIICSLCHSLT
jgi:hypothetical protein